MGIEDRGVVIEDRGVGIEVRCANILAPGIAEEKWSDRIFVQNGVPYVRVHISKSTQDGRSNQKR